jgi:hypothetical protein
VPGYYLYFHNSRGHFLRRQDVEAPDDEAALKAARDIDHSYCVEVWFQDRKVGIVHPEGKGKISN